MLAASQPGRGTGASGGKAHCSLDRFAGCAGRRLARPSPWPSPMCGGIIPNGKFRTGERRSDVSLWAGLPQEQFRGPLPRAETTHGGQMGLLSTEDGAGGSLQGEDLGRKRGGGEEEEGLLFLTSFSHHRRAWAPGLGACLMPSRLTQTQGPQPPEPGNASAMQALGSTQTHRIRNSEDGGRSNGCDDRPSNQS